MPGRHSFIPPFRRPRLPVHQPVTIAEDLASGYGYRALVGGQNFEVLSQSGLDADGLPADYGVGDHAVARRVEGGKQLFIPSPRRAGSAIFCAPGENLSNPGNHGKADLYKRSNNGIWSVHLTITGDDPDLDGLQISYAFWWPANKKFYVFTSDTNGNTMGDMYEVDPFVPQTATKLGFTSVLNEIGADPDNVVLGACIFGGNVYIVGSQNSPTLGDSTHVYKFDGSTLTHVDDDGGTSAASPPTIGIVTDGAAIYYHSATVVRSSSDGSTWAEDQEIRPSPGSGYLAFGHSIYNTVRAKMLIPTRHENPTPDEAAVLRRDASWVEDTTLEVGPANQMTAVDIGMRRSTANIQLREYIRHHESGDDEGIWSRPIGGGAYTEDGDIPAQDYVSGIGKWFGSIEGRIFYFGVDKATDHSRIWSRTSDSGVWTEEHDFGGQGTNPGYASRVSGVTGLFEANIDVPPEQL